MVSEYIGKPYNYSVEVYTVAELTADRLDHAEHYYKAKSSYYHFLYASKPLTDMFGPMPVDEFGPSCLRAVRDEYVAHGYCRAVCNRYTRSIVQMFKWGVSHELVASATWQTLSTVEPLVRGKTTAKDYDAKKPVSWEDVKEVIDESNPEIADMIQLQWNTGARSQNICTISREEIDRESDPWVWEPKVHKTIHAGKTLKMFLGPQSQELLIPRLLKEPFFVNRRGNAYVPDMYRHNILAAIDRINERRTEKGVAPMPRWTPHQLRHARATLIREKYGIEAAQMILGHSDLKTTQIYAEPSFDLARRIASSDG